MDDQHICKLQGYCGGGDEQMLVYDHARSGSLSDYLFGSLCKALLNWRSRMRIALGAARALAYIHDLAPIEVRQFRTCTEYCRTVLPPCDSCHAGCCIEIWVIVWKLCFVQVVYNDFKSSSILLDLDFSVKLAGQGLDVIAWQDDKLNKAASTVRLMPTFLHRTVIFDEP